MKPLQPVIFLQLTHRRFLLKIPAIWFVFFITACESNNRHQPAEQPLNEAVKEREMNYKGRLFTSGLSHEEREKLGLSAPVYQITGKDNYFFPGHDSLQAYIGSCVGIEGALQEGWTDQPESINGQFTYNRSAVEVKALRLLGTDECTEAEVEAEESLWQESEWQAYRGSVGRMERPAPDISYDYTLQLETPFRDEHNAMQPNRLVKRIPLVAFKPEQLAKLEEAVAKKQTITVQAVLKRGYAEQSVLQLVRIQGEE